MSKEFLKGLIDLIPQEDIETIYNIIIKFIPEDRIKQDERAAIEAANKRIAEQGTISHSDINWN